MEYEFSKKMGKEEMIKFLRELADQVEAGEYSASPKFSKVKLNNPLFSLHYEYSEKEYGRRLDIELKMKDYD
ncbi:hypothetical protein GF412_03185 [Candidatus Micrarchaeota archaeon]|nr:hypothetical protein [Candidatus Micrarchaeota archaeon]MBD3417957.1 hypothetical protein [Candidatus Micrarchaeota archaeon]